MKNQLFYGDNLDVLKKHIASESVDLVYLDPPFNSNRDFNVLFKEQSGEPAQAQIKAFTDTWEWSEKVYDDFITSCPTSNLVDLMEGFVKTLGRNDVTAYLVMMAPRLVELHRVLKPTGSLYLHCDQTASHYLKLVLDSVFGPTSFKSEIAWKRTFAHGNVGRNYGAVYDSLLFYCKSRDYTWSQTFIPLNDKHVQAKFKYQDKDGRVWQSVTLRNPGLRPNLHYPYTASNGVTYQPHPNGWSCNLERMQSYDRDGRLHFPKEPTGALRLKMYLDETKGSRLENLWDDIPPLNSQAQERLGYPTQKPLALLERIILASTNEGDVVLDPFCGCGTAVVAAQKLRRNWIGIDITHLAIALIKYRVSDMFGLIEKKDYAVHGEPTTEAEARALSTNDALRKEFEKWAVSLIPRARPANDGKKGADGGIDGVLHFKDDLTAPKKVLIQVKSGKVGSPQINQLRGTVEREKATLGLFVTLEQPTSVMTRDAESFGFYTSHGVRIPRLQIRTIAQLLRGEGFALPYAATVYGVQSAGAGQTALDF